MKIENCYECFVQLWQRLELTRQLCRGQCKRFCIRRILKTWFGLRANDDFIWEVCWQATQYDEEPVCGWDELPPPSLFPRCHRELLRAIVAVRLGITMCQVNLQALDAAYRAVFPKSTPINVNKKNRVTALQRYS